MKRHSPEAIWQMTNEELLSTLDHNSLSDERKTIHFYAPSFMYYRTSHYRSSPTAFPTISVTGKGCALKCKHCGGIVLDTMYPAETPEELFELCRHLKRKGASGCLISGGCLPNGSVPLDEFIDAISKVKHELGLTIFVHTGIISLDTARKLRRANVDAALIDIIGSDETIKEIYNLNVTVDDYESSLKALHEAGIAFVPHLIVGLHYGELKGEWHALKMIQRYAPSAIVIISFMPIKGTEMASHLPPTPAETAKVIATARLMFPKTPLVLGCMRPKGKHGTKTDVLALKAGVDAIAFPSEEAIEYAESGRFAVSFSSLCCSQIYADFGKLASSA
jgi:uncharacterized radical SAM superfamily protein